MMPHLTSGVVCGLVGVFAGGLGLHLSSFGQFFYPELLHLIRAVSHSVIPCRPSAIRVVKPVLPVKTLLIVRLLWLMLNCTCLTFSGCSGQQDHWCKRVGRLLLLSHAKILTLRTSKGHRPLVPVLAGGNA